MQTAHKRPGRSVLSEGQSGRARLKVVSNRQHPLDTLRGELREQVDMHDLFVCSRETFESILEAAPTKIVRAWLQGIFDSRVILAAVTGQHF